MGDFIADAGLVLLGFVLALLWDLLKSERERRQRDASTMIALREEVVASIATVEANGRLLDVELGLMETGAGRLLTPLDPIPRGVWELVRVSVPRDITRHRETLPLIRLAARLVDQINERIRSREAFRVSNHALSSLNTSLAQYDRNLERLNQDLLHALNQLRVKIDPKMLHPVPEPIGPRARTLGGETRAAPSAKAPAKSSASAPRDL
jgi:hypothetical protein